jgi:hypothetical protein
MKKLFISQLLNTTNKNFNVLTGKLLLSFAFDWAERFMSVYVLSLELYVMKYLSRGNGYLERYWLHINVNFTVNNVSVWALQKSICIFHTMCRISGKTKLIGIIELGVPIALGLIEQRHAIENDESINCQPTWTVA